MFALFVALAAVGVTTARAAGLRRERPGWGRILLLLTFLLSTLSQVSELYIAAIAVARRPWVYELSEIALVLFTPTWWLLLMSTRKTGHAGRIFVPCLLLTAVSVAAYGYGNFLDTSAWATAYAAMSGTLVLSVLCVCSWIIGSRVHRERAPKRGYRAVATATLCITALRVVLEAASRVGLAGAAFPALELLAVPLACAAWGVLFIVEDARAWVATERLKGQGIAVSADRFGLSVREREVAELLLDGKRYADIGDALFISKATVKTHIGRIYRKVGVTTRMGLANRLMPRG